LSAIAAILVNRQKVARFEVRHRRSWGYTRRSREDFR
jgi:hypothetical protein